MRNTAWVSKTVPQSSARMRIDALLRSRIARDGGVSVGSRALRTHRIDCCCQKGSIFHGAFDAHHIANREIGQRDWVAPLTERGVLVGHKEVGRLVVPTMMVTFTPSTAVICPISQVLP